MNLFYDSLIENFDKSFILSEEESHHALRVLRMKKGDTLNLINGKGSLFTTEIIGTEGKKCHLNILDVKTVVKSEKEVHIAIAPTKNMDRNEWFVEKATEIGITEISWILCDNSERKIIKNERIEKTVISAIKQSNRLFIPKINELIPLKEFVKKHPTGAIAHCYNNQEKKEIKEIYKLQNFPILIGPEGDFSLDELRFIKDFNYNGISLGENRLRTETAALVACFQCVFN